MNVLTRTIRTLEKECGGLRAAARAIGVSAPYLQRLRDGKYDKPADWVLDRLGLERQVIYTVIVRQPMRQTMNNDYPTANCPQCGSEQEDMDGFGVIYCDECGYCGHISSTNGVCDLCGREIDHGLIHVAYFTADGEANIGEEHLVEISPYDHIKEGEWCVFWDEGQDPNGEPFLLRFEMVRNGMPSSEQGFPFDHCLPIAEFLEKYGK